MSKMDGAIIALLVCLGLSYFNEWFLVGAGVVVLAIIGWLFAESLGWVK